MSSRIHIFDHFCNPIAELSSKDAPTTPRSWVLNDHATCNFSVAPQFLYDNFHPREETVIQYGNLLFIEHVPMKDADNSVRGTLPDWVGFIFNPREWKLNSIDCTAYSMEGLLEYRPMPFVDNVKGTPKELFTQIIDYANQAPALYPNMPVNLKFQLGVVEDLPISMSDNLRGSAKSHIQTLCKRTGMEWNITAKINSRGDLVCYANLYQRRGVDTNARLTNTNTEATPDTLLLSEQGNISNVILGHSQANVEADRAHAFGVNQSSLDEFGYFGLNQTYMGLRDAASVGSAAQATADARGFPRRTLQKIGVLDYRDTFSYLSVGNTLMRHENNVGFAPGGGFGFDARARILSVDYNDMSDKCQVNLEVMD